MIGPGPHARAWRVTLAGLCATLVGIGLARFAYTPLLILVGMGCVILLAETFVRGPSRAGLAWLGVAACVAALAAVVMQWPDAAEAKSHFDSMLVVDRMALYLDGAFIIATGIGLWFATGNPFKG